ncbi:MAG: triose-phosphate isomerase [bacterium TMED88]|nr:triose-phosphate isomerase [Deltaproteobacteria bacterium]OUV31686.1 MAG: triose-phosphate isomerase [bacterium TMED88]
MRRPIIAANWKLNMLRHEAQAFLVAFRADWDAETHEASPEIIIAPPFTALETAARALNDCNVALAGQNVFFESSGAFTGEISPAMLRDAGCRYCIVGHSERRSLFAETDQEISRKAHALLKAGVRPIICVGETLEEREAGKTEDVLAAQLDGSLEDLEPVNARDIVLAYEPVWAIGTGRTATPEQAQETHAFIRAHLQAGRLRDQAKTLRIQYGGSVKPDNIRALMARPDIDGALVGGASLRPDSFARIACFDQPENTSS